MPKGEFENLLRFEASRRKERGHGINEKGIGRNGWKCFYFTEGKKEGAVDRASEKPSVFTPTAVDEELTMFVSKIYEDLTHRKELKTTLHALN